MKNIAISLIKASVLEEVALNTAYTGVKTDAEKGFFDRVATIDEDEELLSRVWKKVCGEVIEKLKQYISAINIKDESMELSLEMSGAYDDTLTPALITDIKDAVAAGVTAGWFSFSCPEKAKDWENMKAGLLTNAFSKLCSRKKPVRKT